MLRFLLLALLRNSPALPRSSSNCPAGQTNNSKKLRRTETKDLWAQLLERGVFASSRFILNSSTSGALTFLFNIRSTRFSMRVQRHSCFGYFRCSSDLIRG